MGIFVGVPSILGSILGSPSFGKLPYTKGIMMRDCLWRCEARRYVYLYPKSM